ncbi:MAG: hypothetical protein ACT452_18935 [Microthrixaceae bacterium]
MGDDWVLPRGSGRSTTIGNLDSVARASIDPAGLITLEGASWSLDWWIGAEDRWHLPCREAAVRQSLVSGSPVVETRVRVPSGDAVHRAYAARSVEGAEAVVVEIENASKVPFAVALALRPHTGTGDGRLTTIAIDGSVVQVDGLPALVLGRSPGRVALSDAARGDAADVVFGGDAAPVGPAAVSCADGLANGAFLFPLAHAATLRVVLPLGSADGAAGPSTYPSAAQVASGWGTHASRGTRIEVPDRRLRDAVAASTRHLLLGDRSPAVATALDLMGFPQEAGRLLTADPVGLARASDAGAALRALGRHWELTRDVEFAGAVVAVVAALYPRVRRAELGLASLLEAAGERRAASDVLAAGVDPAIDLEPDGLDGRRDLADLLAGASSTWTWATPEVGHDLTANAALVSAVRALLVTDARLGLSLSPLVPEAWLGQGWELHDAPTRHGQLSFAVRWHGERPALLWELAAHPGDAPITITAPGLDPSWSTQAPAGEALLAPVAVPERAPRRGLTIPVSIEPMPGRSS